MTPITALICPHTSVPETTLKAILSFFESVKIGRPWFMDQPLPLAESGAIQVLLPNEELKPPEEFKKILGEYRRWISRSHEKSFDAFLAFQEGARHKEESTWEIRGALRHKQNRNQDRRRQHTLKWHLLLHLAQEMEEQRREAQTLLRALKEKDPPLRGAIEEEGELPSPLADLSESDGPLILSEAVAKQVLEAWFSLFVGHWRGEDVLSTLSPAIFQHLCDTWEPWGSGSASAEVEFSAPDFSQLSPREMAEAKSRFLDSREGTALREAVLGFLKGDFGMSRGKMDAIGLEGLTGRKMFIRLRHFSPLERSSGKERVAHFSGKTIALIRDGYTHGD